MPEQTDTLQHSLTSLRQSRSRIFAEESISDAAVNENGDTMSQSTPNRHATIGLPATIKLAPLPIKPFDGDVLDWPEFKATCESTFTHIMDEVSRFRYLKSHLHGEPYRMVKHLPLTPGSYKRAMDLLTKRFDNERAIINANIKLLITLPELTAESSKGLKHMVDTTNECIAAINSYNIETDSWSCILIFLLTQRLDKDSIKFWEENIKGRRTVPQFSEFIEYLETRINVLESAGASNSIAHVPKKSKTFVNMESMRKCNICVGNTTHFTYLCPELLATAPIDRERFVNEKGLCTNCLHFHKVENCTSRFSCKICKQRHNSALHLSEKCNHVSVTDRINELMIENPELDHEAVQAIEMAGEIVAHVNDGFRSPVLLATAVIKIECENRVLYAKSLIDQGSTANLISERVCKALDLPMERMNMPITGVCDTVSYKVRYRATFTLKSMVNPNYSVKINALIVPKITTLNQHVSFQEWPHLSNIELADPHMEQSIELMFFLVLPCTPIF